MSDRLSRYLQMTAEPSRTTRIDEERIFIALDVESRSEADRIVRELSGFAVGFKIGLQLFTVAGPEFVKELSSSGHRVFLDLKFHDIPNTVAEAVVSAARTGAWMINVHSLGGSAMMARAAEVLRNESYRRGIEPPKLIAVTVLTSSDQKTMNELGIGGTVEETVQRLAMLTKEAGLDGVVASAEEAATIRNAAGNDFLIVTPGIRPANATLDDQKRVTTPADAIRSGADLLVIGRPVTAAQNMQTALNSILEGMDSPTDDN